MVMREYTWLLVGGAAAGAVAGLGLGSRLADALGNFAALPWGSFGTGALVFAAFAGIHFRSQLVRSLERQRDGLERQAAASRLILAASSDGRRWLRVVQENLALVTSEGTRPNERQLYLAGAVANADKLEQAFERIEGNQRRLDASDERSEGNQRRFDTTDAP